MSKSLHNEASFLTKQAAAVIKDFAAKVKNQKMQKQASVELHLDISELRKLANEK